MTLVLRKKQDDQSPLTVTPELVASRFGWQPEQLVSLLDGYPWPQLSYRVLQGNEREDIMLGILKRIEKRDFRVAGGNDNAVWIRGWGEILEQIENQGFSPELLRPQYFDHHRIMRFGGEYIDGGDAGFVYQYDQLLRRIVLGHYLKGQRKVVELGCGTGTSQLMLAELLPDAELVASDWSPPSQGIIRAMASYLQRDIRPVCFNMLTLEGWDDLTVDHETAVVTVHALEQLGDKCKKLLDRLVAVKPKLCLHLEPVIDLYDEDTLFDYLAVRYHTERNYLSGWLPSIRELARSGKADILDERRLQFGDRYHEAYSVIVWRPL